VIRIFIFNYLDHKMIIPPSQNALLPSQNAIPPPPPNEPAFRVVNGRMKTNFLYLKIFLELYFNFCLYIFLKGNLKRVLIFEPYELFFKLK